MYSFFYSSGHSTVPMSIHPYLHSVIELFIHHPSFHTLAYQSFFLPFLPTILFYPFSHPYPSHSFSCLFSYTSIPVCWLVPLFTYLLFLQFKIAVYLSIHMPIHASTCPTYCTHSPTISPLSVHWLTHWLISSLFTYPSLLIPLFSCIHLLNSCTSWAISPFDFTCSIYKFIFLCLLPTLHPIVSLHLSYPNHPSWALHKCGLLSR
jgi:hypothetical protein